MQSKAYPIALGGMLAAAAVVLMSIGTVIPVATYAAPILCMAVGQIVLSGVQGDLDKVKPCAAEMGIKRALPLQVAGAFHSPLMQEAAEKMRCVLDETKFSVPKVPVYFNVTATTESDVGCYADLMVRQIVSPVRWRELILNTKANSFIECGSGNVLCGLIKRIVPDAQTVALNSSETIQSFLK